MKYSMLKNHSKIINSNLICKALISRSQLKLFSNLSKTQEVQGLKDFKDVSHHETFLANETQVIKTTTPMVKPDYNKPIPFGVYHTDHLFEVDYDLENGWSKPLISPWHQLMIDPTNSALHYAIQLFEGMKAYRNVNNPEELLLFRPEMNMNRMLISAQRLGLPSFNGEELIKCIEKFVNLDKDWVPYQRGYSLYIRPTYISMTNQLGVLPPREAKVFTVLSPVGPYFPTGFSAIKIVCSEDMHRSWPGGFGYAKLGANYGPTLEYFKRIKDQGYHQILWLINDVVSEVGVMNFFVFWTNKQGEKELITCPLDGTILPGVIRDSVITLAKEWGVKVTQRHFTIHEILDSLKEGRFHEAFGTGTAAIICPIKEIAYKNQHYSLFKDADQNVGDLGKKLYNTLLDIQTGVVKHPWSRSIIH